MAKERKQNSIEQAIKSVTTALRLEGIANPTDEQKQQIQDAKIEAANVIDNSNVMTMAQNIDENIELQHQQEEQAEQEQAEQEQVEQEIELEPEQTND